MSCERFMASSPLDTFNVRHARSPTAKNTRIRPIGLLLRWLMSATTPSLPRAIRGKLGEFSRGLFHALHLVQRLFRVAELIEVNACLVHHGEEQPAHLAVGLAAVI